MKWGDYSFSEEQEKNWTRLCEKTTQELAAIIIMHDNSCKDCKLKDARIERYRKAAIQKDAELRNQKNTIDDMVEYLRSRRQYYNYLSAKRR